MDGRILLLACLATVSVAGPALASFQAADQVMLDGKKISLLVYPLDPWLEAHPGALPEPHFYSTGNPNGYDAEWEIRQGRLWLRQVTMTVAGPPKKVKVGQLEQDASGKFVDGGVHEQTMSLPEERDITAKLFPDSGKQPIPADWFSGTLVAVLDDDATYIHYGPTDRHYAVLWIERGSVSRRVDLGEAQFVQFRDDRFAAFQRTQKYRERFAITDPGDDGDVACEVYWNAAEIYLALDTGEGGSGSFERCR